MRHLLLFILFLLPACLFSQQKGAVRINEVMANPNGLTELPPTEYVELYNSSDQPVDLAGWQFYYGDRPVPLKPVLLPADGFLLLYRDGRDIYVDDGGLLMPLADFPYNLSNEGKSLSLYDGYGNISDLIFYPKAVKGFSWERLADGFELSLDTRHATPGSRNSVDDGKPVDKPDVDEPVIDNQSFSAGSLIINEVMADPKGLTAFPETEYVEIHNTTDKSLPLDGFIFVYGEREIALMPEVVEAGAYLLLYRSGRDIHVDPNGHAMALDNFPSSLSNTGKSLSIKGADGEIIDQISYGKAKPGVSLERDGDHFRLSTDSRGGTPGAPNSSKSTEPAEQDNPIKPDKPIIAKEDIMAGDIVFNELLPNPFPEASEYIELYNRSGKELPLSGLSISVRKGDGSLSRLYSLSSVYKHIAPGGYILLTRSIDGVSDFYLSASIEVMCEVSLPALANTSATLVLLNTSDSSVVDEVSYSSEWHSPMIRDQRGVALERIDPDGESQDRLNWASASEIDGYGTPGYRNSQHEIANPEAATSIDPPLFSDITNEYIIRYHTDMTGYTCRAWVFNSAGKRLAEISNMALLGSEGEIKWSGLDSKGSKLRSGVYIFYAELIHPEGSVKRVKEVFLVK